MGRGAGAEARLPPKLEHHDLLLESLGQRGRPHTWDPMLRTLLARSPPSPQKVPLLCCFAGVDWATTGWFSDCVFWPYPDPRRRRRSCSRFLSVQLQPLPRPRTTLTHTYTHARTPVCCSLARLLICCVPGPNSLLSFVSPSPPPHPAVLRDTHTSFRSVTPRRCSRQPRDDHATDRLPLLDLQLQPQQDG